MYKITIPTEELNFTFSRSSGAGGQNVNKVNSKVLLYWNINESNACPEEVKYRFKSKYPYLVSEDGSIQIMSQKTRNQKDNISDCIEKLHALLQTVAERPKVRKKTKPKRSSVEKRLMSKKKDSNTKKMRQKNYG
jgi:ribosome-associated protein